MLLSLCGLLACASAVRAQGVAIGAWPNGSIDLSDAGSAALKGAWRMQEGDDPAFAHPDYDDKAWSTLSLAHPGQSQSPAKFQAGWHWYRLHLRLPLPHPLLGLLVTGGDGTYEVFVNGAKLPGASLSSPLFMTVRRARSFPIPAVDSDLEIALRTFVPPSSLYASSRGPLLVRLGTQAETASELGLDLDSRLGLVEPSVFINLLIVLTGLIVLVLFAVQRRHREYLWLGLSLVLIGSSYAAWTLTYVGFLPMAVDAPGNSVFYLSLATLVEFTFAFAGRKINRGWRLYQLLLVVAAASMYFLIPGQLTTLAFNVEQVLVVLPSALLLPLQLLIWYRRGNREAGWLIVPMLISSLTLVLYDVGAVAAMLGWKQAAWFTQNWQMGPVPLQQWDIANLIFVPAIAIVIFLRFLHLSHEQARASAELDAARELQQHLVPATLPPTPAYRIQTAYIPATEVGGDFYQVLSQPGGATLIVLGDVSGKGLRAAMTGALAIGALRTLAAEDLTPAAILTRLNLQIVDAQNGGFITCLCALLKPSGQLTLANAGHLCPYHNGIEVAVDNGLPLGLDAAASYAETFHQLQPGDQLTLLTDGILEARSTTRELFGFDRTASISARPAEEIAQTAQAFGQDDDITVITLAFNPAEGLHGKTEAVLTSSPGPHRSPPVPAVP